MHTHTSTNNKNKEKKTIMLKFLLSCKLFVPIRIKPTAKIMVHECVMSAIADTLANSRT
jgi:hypothetical protein